MMKHPDRVSVCFIGLIAALTFGLTEEADADSRLNAFLWSGYQAAVEKIPQQANAGAEGMINWFDDPVAKIGTDNDGERRYALRVRPKFSGERTAEKKIRHLEAQQQDLIRESILADALKKRYAEMIDMMDHQTRVKQYTLQLQHAKATLELIRDQAGTKDFKPEQFQVAELDIFMLEEQIRHHSERLAGIYETGGLSLPAGAADEDWTAGLISLPSMIEHVASINRSPSGLGAFPLLMRKTLAASMAQEAYQLEKTQRNALIRYVELEHNDRRQPQSDTTEVSLCFALPTGSGVTNIGKRANDLNLARLNLRASQLQTEQKMNDIAADLNWRFRQYGHVEKAILRIDGRLAMPQEFNHPSLLLRLKQEKLSRHKILWEHHQAALRAYLDFLHLTGRLTEKPLRNRLLASEPKLRARANMTSHFHASMHPAWPRCQAGASTPEDVNLFLREP